MSIILSRLPSFFTLTPPQSYGLIAGIGFASIYSAVSSIVYGPADHRVPPTAGLTPRPAAVDTTVHSVGHDADTLLGAAKAHIPAILAGKEEEGFVTVKREGEKDRHLPSRLPKENKLERMLGTRGGG